MTMPKNSVIFTQFSLRTLNVQKTTYISNIVGKTLCNCNLTLVRNSNMIKTNIGIEIS